MDIGDDTPTLPAVLSILHTDPEQKRSRVSITIQEGRYHRSSGCLKRSEEGSVPETDSYGPLELDPSLPKGQARRLTEEEIRALTDKADKGE